MSTTKLRKLTVVFEYYEALETYSRINLIKSYALIDPSKEADNKQLPMGLNTTSSTDAEWSKTTLETSEELETTLETSKELETTLQTSEELETTLETSEELKTTLETS